MADQEPKQQDHLWKQDVQRDTGRAAGFWATTGVLYTALVVAYPPTARIGSAGLAVIAVIGFALVGYMVYLQRLGAKASKAAILGGGFVGVFAIGGAQWLGGPDAPIETLFMLGVFGNVAVISGRYMIVYLAIVTCALAAPLVYDGADGPALVGRAVYAAMLWIAGLFLAEFGRRLRRQRRALVEAERSAADRALTDALTSLGNRRALDTALDERIKTGVHFTLLYLDLNGFKSYNDRFGHAAGDALLRRMGHSLTDAVKGTDKGYRLGGDEFCALLSGTLDADDLAVRRVIAALTEHGAGFSITPAYGVVLAPTDARDADTALRIADERMYTDKRGGRKPLAQEMSELLLSAVRERAPEAPDHSADVVSLALRVANRLPYPPEEIHALQLAAEQHDIGKLALPDRLLSKPGRLDDDEWELVRHHPVVGARILAATESLRPAAPLVRASHERWDGSGYPSGLAGEEIPLGARIIAVCDAYLAMMNEQPGRSALTEDAALAELTRCARSQFDPSVVSEFVAMVEAGLEPKPDRSLAVPALRPAA